MKQDEDVTTDDLLAELAESITLTFKQALYLRFNTAKIQELLGISTSQAQLKKLKSYNI